MSERGPQRQTKTNTRVSVTGFNVSKPRLTGWQREVRDAIRDGEPGIILASLPKGSGKSYLCARIVAEYLNPSSVIHAPGSECIAIAASLQQSLPIFNQLLGMVNKDAFQVIRNSNEIRLHDKVHDTGLKVGTHSLASAQGLGSTERILLADEVGVWTESVGKKF